MRAAWFFLLFTACANPLVPDAGMSGTGGGGGASGGQGGSGGGVDPTTNACGMPTPNPLPCSANGAPCDGCCAGATCVSFDAQATSMCGQGGVACAPCAAGRVCKLGVCSTTATTCPPAQTQEPLTESATGRAPPPISGGTLAVIGEVVVVADPDRDLVYLVNPDDSVRTVTLVAGEEPGRVSAGPNGRAFVALRRAGAVAEIDVAAGTIAARHAVCPTPRGLAWSAAHDRLSVACASGDLVELTFAGSAVTTVTSHPSDELRDVLVSGDDLILSTFRDARLIKRSGAPFASPASLTTTTQSFRPRVLWRSVLSPDGAVLMAHQRAQNSMVNLQGPLCGSPPGPPNPTGGGGSPYGGPGGGFDGGTLGAVHSVITRSDGTNVTTVAILDGIPLPVDLAKVPNQDAVVVASATHGVFFIGNLTNGSLVQQLHSGMGFTSVGYRGDALVAFFRDPALLLVRSTMKPPYEIPLNGSRVSDTGHGLFHGLTATMQLSVACASCHPEGGDDGHVWLLPEGQRRTQSLRGGLKGTEPFHWGGDQASMGSLMSDIFVRRMGGKTLTADRSAKLLSWIDGIPKLTAPERDPAAVQRGKALFASAELACATCHGGPLGTNNCTVFAGTGEALQVPRLVELVYRAPYFHDGRVPTLKARFTPVGGGDLHGKVTHLTPAQIDDLVTYLESR